MKKASAIVHAFVQDGQACPGFPASNDGFSVSRNVTLDASGATRFEIDLPVGIPPPKALRSPLFDR